MIINENFERFQYFKFETDFLENENLFSKTGVRFFSWKHLDWKRIISIKNCHIRSQCETNRMMNTKWAYHKERSFASNYFIFLKICFNLKTNYKELIWCTNNPNVHSRTFCKRTGVLFDGAFTLWVSLSITLCQKSLLTGKKYD